MSAENQCNLPENCKVILLDVAGTTTSINFVKEKLFPFAVTQAEAFLKANWEDEAVKEAVKNLNPEKELDISAAAETVKELTENNSHNIGLKSLQGLLFKKGYEDGEIKAHVFGDVSAALENWTKNYLIAIYSTGSVDSQKLLFSNTIAGNLASHISKYFDQTVGSKTDSKSYENIAAQLDIKSEELVFITDNIKEATAAKTAKAAVILIEREGNEQLSEDAKNEFTVINSFADISSANSTKRKNEEETDVAETRPSKLPKTEEETKEQATDAATKTEQAMEVDGEEKNEVKTVEETIEKTDSLTVEKKDTVAENETENVKNNEKTENGDNKPVESEDKTEKPSEENKNNEVVVAEESKKEPEIEGAKNEELEEKIEEKAVEEKEKENKGEIANGVVEPEEKCDTEEVNGKKVENGDVEEVEEIKVKRIEETEEKTDVSVECA